MICWKLSMDGAGSDSGMAGSVEFYEAGIVTLARVAPRQ